MRPVDGGARLGAIRLALCVLACALAVGLDLRVAPAAATASIVVCPTCATRSLAAAIAAAAPGSRIEVRGGTYPGGLTIDRPVELVGSGDPVIDGGGGGTLLRIAGARVAISGFVLRGTGDDLDQEDAAIVVDHGQASIVDNQIEDALFGVYLKQAPGSVIRNNVIISKKLDIARRGDSIKVWYSDDVTIDNNRASDGRDNILWYSNRGVVTNNVFDRGRYGLHLMFSDGARIERNSLQSNSIGLYIMYSRDPLVVGNTLSNNHGPSGGGLGFKDVDRATVEGNRFVNNHIAAQIDTSPREPGIENIFRGNVFAFNTIGIGFSPAVRHNTLTANSFIDNVEQVAILGGGQLRDITWAVAGRGNYWSDYAGYDANGDGIGDLPYRSQRLFEALVSQEPVLRLFTYSPAAMAVDFAAKAMPVARPEVKLEDPDPLLSPVWDPALPPVPAAEGPRLTLGTAGLATVLAAASGVVALRRPRRTFAFAARGVG